MMERIKTTLRSKDRFKRILDYFLSLLLFALPESLRARIFRGEQHQCPICQSYLRSFITLHRPYHRWCPVCHSLKRHRLLWLFFERKTSLFDKRAKKILHIAPEPAFESRLKILEGVEYVSGDLDPRKAMIELDITAIDLPDESQDVIICNHVLEHIPDDQQAMSELARVLKSDGYAVITVPITADATFEDTSITDPVEREKVFGQSDHVRRYGMDVITRLEQNYFDVATFTTEDIVEDGEIQFLGLPIGDPIFFCRKS